LWIEDASSTVQVIKTGEAACVASMAFSQDSTQAHSTAFDGSIRVHFLRITLHRDRLRIILHRDRLRI
jgi:hypothetical protein